MAFPGFEHYQYGGHELSLHGDSGYDHGYDHGDYGHHQISERIGESHGHDYHHEEDEHVDYYVSICCAA